jgi:hypothetical protein
MLFFNKMAYIFRNIEKIFSSVIGHNIRFKRRILAVKKACKRSYDSFAAVIATS